MVAREIFAVWNRETDQWATYNGYPHWGEFKDAQLYYKKNQASARANLAKEQGRPAEVVRLNVTICGKNSGCARQGQSMNETFIKFSEIAFSGKTKRWEVFSDEDHFLGRIQWRSGWRCYTFEPCFPSAFEQICLRDIASFIENQTALQKKSWLRA